MKVLIAVDNSKFAAEVMGAVAKRAWPKDTEFLILDVVETCSLPGSTESFLHQCRILLDGRVTSLLKRLPTHKVESEVVEGAAKEQIVEVADRYGADLIIIGAHGESGIKRRRVGNIVTAVVNHADCSVEVIKPHRVSPPQQTAKRKQTKSTRSQHALHNA
jgi:nucleotide-binding universal stress UspA family protein